MTYDGLLQLIPVMLNRTAGELSGQTDLIRRAVKYAYNYALSRVQLDAFYAFADVDLTVSADLTTSGVLYGNFVDINAAQHNFVNVQGISSLDVRGEFYDGVEIITRKHRAFREILRRPFHRTEYVADYFPQSRPVAYLASGRIYFTWFNEAQVPSTVRVRLEGTISLPDLMDDDQCTAAQLVARNWLLDNAENYLLAKSLEFLQIYLKEDDRASYYAGLADKEFTAMCVLDSALNEPDSGITLD